MNFISNSKILIPKDLYNKINQKIVFIVENIGIPIRIPAMGIGNYSFDNVPFLLDENSVVIAVVKGEKKNHYLLLDTKNENILHQWNYDQEPNNIFINSSIEQLLLCTYSFDFVIKRLIEKKSLGPYYDNSPKGGNFEKYAELLKEMIFDIDERATSEGAWFSLIQEMSIGAI